MLSSVREQVERARAFTSTAIHYEFDLSNFRRKVVSNMAFGVPVDAEPRRGPDGGRPAALYRGGTASLLQPSLPSRASRAAALLDDPDPDEDEP